MRIKKLVFRDGERFPILIGSDGIPLFYPTVYEAIMRRQINLASETLEADLRGIKLLYRWAEHQHIDLETRFKQGKFLTIHEIINLAKAFKYRSKSYFGSQKKLRDDQMAVKNQSKTSSLEKFRKSEPERQLLPASTKLLARRLYTAVGYLDWLAQIRTSWASTCSQEYEAFQKARLEMKKNLESRIPEIKRDEIYRREGLSKETQEILLEVIDPESSRNPWKNEFTRLRNQLFIHMLLKLGPRRSEILLTRTQRDINTRTNTLSIIRVPDDKDDPRRDEPNSKTLERELDFDEDLAKMVTTYITKIRNTIKGARGHDFLFVAANTGRPLSKSAVTKMFRVLREKVPDLPDDFTAHVLRHTMNDNFSEVCDETGVDEETEKKTRCYLNGWKDGSRTAEVYTRRYVKRKAQEVSLGMQEKISKGGKKDDGKK